MAVWSEIPFNRLAGSLRLDAEYYDPGLLRSEAAVKGFPGGWETLGQMADLVTDGDHLKRNYVDDGVLFLTSENFREHKIDYTSELQIAREYERTLARARSESEAVFLTKTGKWYGKAAVCRTDEPRFNISADVAKIRLRPEYDPYFLACYLNSAIGYALVRRESTGGSRDRIVLENLRNVPVPCVSRTESKYKVIVDRIGAAFASADRLYAQAEALLESTLGLNRLDLAPRLFCTASYADARSAERLDAEYFQPRMQNLLATLSRSGETIADVAELSQRRFKPVRRTEFQYIEIGDVSAPGTAAASTVAGEEAPSRATWVVKPGEVITTTVRPIRRLTAIITDNQCGAVCSSGFAVLTPKKISSQLLLVYLRLPLVCELLDLHTTASMYPAISTESLMKIPIILPDATTKDEIITRVDGSFRAQAEAEGLLDEAKRMVERALLGEG